MGMADTIIYLQPPNLVRTYTSFTCKIAEIFDTREYPLFGYILGVLMHTTAWDRYWRGGETLDKVLKYLSGFSVPRLIS